MGDGLPGRRIPLSESVGRLSSTKEGETGKQAQKEDKPTTTDFTPRQPRWKIDDLVVPAHTLAAIKQAFARIEHHDTLYIDWGLDQLDPQGRRIVVNLYGMPGTGKTMCADAISSQLGKRLIEVSYAEIESKYVGDTPKNIVAAFKAAADTDSLIFFDEADSILGRRMTNVTQAADHGVNVSRAVMLKQLDDFSGVVVFATNLARNFDGAFVRRILTHIEFPLPDHDTRLRLWQKLIPDKLPGRPQISMVELAENSEGISGGDMKNVIILAATSAVTRAVPDNVVRISDMVKAIGHVRKAKQDIGRYDYDGPQVHIEEVLNPLEAPGVDPCS